MHAVIVDRNRQYRAEVGVRLTVDRNQAQAGDTMEWPVQLLAEGADGAIGTPFVPGAKAVVKVLEHIRGDKITIGKYKRRKHMSNRRKGFRAEQTVVEVVSISR
jgi:large subunit ribosomal protein L21